MNVKIGIIITFLCLFCKVAMAEEDRAATKREICGFVGVKAQFLQIDFKEKGIIFSESKSYKDLKNILGTADDNVLYADKVVDSLMATSFALEPKVTGFFMFDLCLKDKIFDKDIVATVGLDVYQNCKPNLNTNSLKHCINKQYIKHFGY